MNSLKFDEISPEKAPRSPPRRASTTRLILMVIATNHMAATQFSSAPYLTAVSPQSIRSSTADPPFAFVPLRAPAVDLIAETHPSSTDAPGDSVIPNADHTRSPLGTFPAATASPETTAPDDPVLAADRVDDSPGEASTENSRSSAAPANRPDEVRLEDFLPFFPETRPTTSRATYQKK